MSMVLKWNRLKKWKNRRLLRKWDKLAARANDVLPESTVQLPSFEELRLAAVDGPLVVVNVSRWRCDALILIIREVGEPAVVGLVELHELTYDDAHAQAKQYLTALTEG